MSKTPAQNTAYEAVQKAVMCLRLEVDESIANDVQTKINNALAEAKREGEARGLERAAERLQGIRLFGHEPGPNCDICIQCQQWNQVVEIIRTLSPDPDYIARVKRDVWEQAAQICDKAADRWAAAAGDEGPEEWAHRQAALAKQAEASYLAAALRSQQTKQ